MGVNRSAIMHKAWKLWRLAITIASRPSFDGAAIEATARANGASYQGAIDARNKEWHEHRRVAGIKVFGDALRIAWAGTRPASLALPSIPAKSLYGEAAARVAADALPWRMEPERQRRLAELSG